jgi:hypothetical protein
MNGNAPYRTLPEQRGARVGANVRLTALTVQGGQTPKPMEGVVESGWIGQRSVCCEAGQVGRRGAVAHAGSTDFIDNSVRQVLF